MPFRVNLTKTVRLLMLRNLAFHPLSLAWILLIMYKKSLCLGIERKIGKPRYFLNVLLACIFRVVAQANIVLDVALLEKNALDFLRLSFWPTLCRSYLESQGWHCMSGLWQ